MQLEHIHVSVVPRVETSDSVVSYTKAFEKSILANHSLHQTSTPDRSSISVDIKIYPSRTENSSLT